MKTDTPRTEAQISVLPQSLTGYASYPDSKEVVPAEFARELERHVDGIRGMLDGALNENIQLRVKLSRARHDLCRSGFSDSDRIDWIEANCCTEGTTMAMPRYSFTVRQNVGNPGRNLRWAIDAAGKDKTT